MAINLKKTLALASLGMTQQDAINAVIAVISRRVYVTTYIEGDNFETFTSELKRFFGDPDYRKMLMKVGKQVRKNVLGRSNVFDAFAGLADEHSMGIRTIRDKLEYDDPDSFQLDDEVVDGFIQDGVRLITDFLTPGLDQQDLDPATPSESPTVTSMMLSGFQNLGQFMTVTDMFPDIGHLLTPIDPQQTWLSTN